MAQRIAVIQGHPDAQEAHLCHALADAYAKGAEAAGHEVRRIRVARLDFPLLSSASDFEAGQPPADIGKAQEALERAEHLVIVYPL